jgi:FtsP/CotA-like multicopper oxidase with cupredoxin domain
MRVTKLLVTLGVISLIAVGCTTERAPSGSAIADVSLGEFKIVPSGPVPARKPVTLRVHNEGAVPHSMAMEVGGRLFESPLLNAGESGSLRLPALEPGSYVIWCTVPGHRESGMESTLTVGASEEAAKPAVGHEPEEIDRAHEAGIKAFPAKTQGVGGLVLEPKIVDGVKLFSVAATPLKWEVSPGKFVEAFGYNSQIPGPEIRVNRGDRIRFIFRNELPESSSVHFHGVEVPNEMDGVPFITQAPVKPGESFTYEFTVVEQPGTYMYHSHHNATEQVGKGLLGAFIVEPDRRDWDVEQTMVLGDGPLGFTLNGKGFPATSPISVNVGQRVFVRFLNEGQQIHPMHLHGFHFTVVSRDGRPVAPYEVDTLAVAPGERYDVVFTASLPGIWAFHCHILSHAESEHGMHGMVTAVMVK